MKPKIAKIVVGLPVDGPFDYAVGKDLQDRIAVGHRVHISFNRRNRIGFVAEVGQRSAFKKLNPVLSLLDDDPVLDKRALELTKRLSSHYGCSLGEAIETYLPAALRQGKASLSSAVLPKPVKKTTIPKNTITLVHDQTRTKRWPFIIEHIQKVIDDEKNVIILVPEGSYIEPTVAVLTDALSCPIAVLDKKMTPKKELEQWGQIREGKFPIVIGTRSAIFAPLPHLGLIVIEDEENYAYKQEQTPHYHACEVAEMRSEIDPCSVLFVSSVPSVEIWEKAKRNKWEKVVFESDRRGKIQAVDMNNYNPGKTSILSFPLQDAIQKTLEKDGKIILFMNRRGFSTRTHCQQCGFIIKCERCNVNLSYLYSQKMMVCRHCNFKKELPKICPQCRGSYLRSTGTGIEKLESEAARHYPNVRIQRYDKESKVFPKDADIIITTQAVFRRHDNWNVALVAMLNFDAQMYHFDFRSGQKAFSLLVHLRQLASEQFLIQTHMTDNYCIKAAKDMNFDKFYREELKQRKELGLPPYRHLVALGLRGQKEDVVFELSQALFDRLEEKSPNGIEISDPHPDVSPKLRDKYRYTILLKGKSVKSILTLIKSVLKGFRKRNILITVNVDP